VTRSSSGGPSAMTSHHSTFTAEYYGKEMLKNKQQLTKLLAGVQ